jgi:YrbI family 3-deoxy-D-manno-octulosonate 8-phosphate phosphatase
MDKNIVAIIPARGGSKGIPKKNIMDFCGKPLLAWSILQAKEAETISQVYVSSDDQRILDIAIQFGALPIRRPKELATDKAQSEPVLMHALDEVERATGKISDLIVFLQATSPLREPKDIDGAVKRLTRTKSDSLFSMAVLEDFCAWTRRGGHLIGLTFDPLRRGRRQDRKPILLENGSIYVFRPEILRRYHNRLGGKISNFEMALWKSYEIDTIEDVDICTYYFEKKLLPYWKRKGGSPKISKSNIDLIVYDFDGVMTDNRVIVLQNGTEAIIANRADGLGVDRFRELGIPQLVISTETNPVVKARAAKLGLEVIGACEDKKTALKAYCEQKGYDLGRVVYIGNDLNDLETMRMVGFPVAPSDAHPEVKGVAKFLTRSKGGEGVIRELVDILLS